MPNGDAQPNFTSLLLSTGVIAAVYRLFQSAFAEHGLLCQALIVSGAGLAALFLFASVRAACLTDEAVLTANACVLIFLRLVHLLLRWSATDVLLLGLLSPSIAIVALQPSAQTRATLLSNLAITALQTSLCILTRRSVLAGAAMLLTVAAVSVYSCAVALLLDRRPSPHAASARALKGMECLMGAMCSPLAPLLSRALDRVEEAGERGLALPLAVTAMWLAGVNQSGMSSTMPEVVMLLVGCCMGVSQGCNHKQIKRVLMRNVALTRLVSDLFPDDVAEEMIEELQAQECLGSDGSAMRDSSGAGRSARPGLSPEAELALGSGRRTMPRDAQYGRNSDSQATLSARSVMRSLQGPCVEAEPQLQRRLLGRKGDVQVRSRWSAEEPASVLLPEWPAASGDGAEQQAAGSGLGTAELQGKPPPLPQSGARRVTERLLCMAPEIGKASSGRSFSSFLRYRNPRFTVSDVDPQLLGLASEAAHDPPWEAPHLHLCPQDSEHESLLTLRVQQMLAVEPCAPAPQTPTRPCPQPAALAADGAPAPAAVPSPTGSPRGKIQCPVHAASPPRPCRSAGTVDAALRDSARQEAATSEPCPMRLLGSQGERRSRSWNGRLTLRSGSEAAPASTQQPGEGGGAYAFVHPSYEGSSWRTAAASPGHRGWCPANGKCAALQHAELEASAEASWALEADAVAAVPRPAACSSSDIELPFSAGGGCSSEVEPGPAVQELKGMNQHILSHADDLAGKREAVRQPAHWQQAAEPGNSKRMWFLGTAPDVEQRHSASGNSSPRWGAEEETKEHLGLGGHDAAAGLWSAVPRRAAAVPEDSFGAEVLSASPAAWPDDPMVTALAACAKPRRRSPRTISSRMLHELRLPSIALAVRGSRTRSSKHASSAIKAKSKTLPRIALQAQSHDLLLAPSNQQVQRLADAAAQQQQSLTASRRGQGIVHHRSMVTVLFTDICGFTNMSEQLSPLVIMDMLNRLYCTYDVLCEMLEVYKLNTVGDGFMVVSGLLADDRLQANRMLHLGIAMLHVAQNFKRPDGRPLHIRVGLHSGPVTAGVVGYTRRKYDVFGDTVNTASRMESSAPEMAIRISDSTFQLLSPSNQRSMTSQETVTVKGKGSLNTHIWRPDKEAPRLRQVSRFCSRTDRTASANAQAGRGVSDAATVRQESRTGPQSLSSPHLELEEDADSGGQEEGSQQATPGQGGMPLRTESDPFPGGRLPEASSSTLEELQQLARELQAVNFVDSMHREHVTAQLRQRRQWGRYSSTPGSMKGLESDEESVLSHTSAPLEPPAPLSTESSAHGVIHLESHSAPSMELLHSSLSDWALPGRETADAGKALGLSAPG